MRFLFGCKGKIDILWLNNVLEELNDEYIKSGAANVVAGVKNILSVNDYDDEVLGMRDKASRLYGLSYEGDPNES